MLILGIDPGTAITGYGLIRVEGNHFQVLEYNCIRTAAKTPLYIRLKEVYEAISALIQKHNPNHFAIEELFFNKNVRTALTVAQSRGVAMLAAANAGIEVYEYTPLQVKQSVVGYGRAEKSQVQAMVKAILNLKETPKPDDVADALAIAICHAHSYKTNNLYKNY